jgi:competence protein ComFC
VDGTSTSGNRFGRRLAEAGDALVSILFPAGCRLCEKLLTRASRIPICEDCLASFAVIQGSLCEICGSIPETSFRAPATQPETGGERERPVCPVCQAGKYAFDRARSYATYQAEIVRAIVMLKFERVEPLGAWFAGRLATIVRQEPELAADIVVPVPLHPQRQKERGYNQADLIARPLARRLGLPYRAVLLVRTRPRPDKHLLTVSERWESVRGAFATRQGSQVDNLRVLLVDDVMTTGATLDACSKAMRGAGAKSVIALTVARAVRHPLANSDYA